MPIDSKPVLDKIYLFKNYTALFATSGEGIFQVDFKNYNFKTRKAIFLAPGQYFKLLYGEIRVFAYEFNPAQIKQIQNSRFLFKHLIGLGHIDLDEPASSYPDFLSASSQLAGETDLLTQAVSDWVKLNPFQATAEQVNLIFDFKDLIDERFAERADLDSVYKTITQNTPAISSLFKEKLQHTTYKLLIDKVLLEAKRKVVFTDQPTKVIAYQTGFRDPAYFNRFFKQKTNLTPTAFRQQYHYQIQDQVIKDLFQLIEQYHPVQHSARFYAERLRLSEKYLAQKVQLSLHTSVKQLIFDKLISRTKALLLTGAKINAIAFELGFKEPNHLTAFFKKQSGLTPTEFLLRQ